MRLACQQETKVRKINMKIIFLDIDGVLNSNAWFKSEEYNIKAKNMSFPDTHLDKKCIFNLNYLCNLSGADIVISSTWREFDYCASALRRNGVTGNIIGTTPCLRKKLENGLYIGKTRGEEIQAWLDNNGYEFYVIIDDCSDMLRSQKKYFVQINGTVGLTKNNVLQALKILNIE